MASGKFKIDQYQHEIDGWRRTLGFMKEENIILKNHLANVLTTSQVYSNSEMDLLENFQTQFLSQDHRIYRLLTIISDEQKLVSREIFEDGQVLNSLISKQRQLRKEMEEAEDEFQKLKADFNAFMSED